MTKHRFFSFTRIAGALLLVPFLVAPSWSGIGGKAVKKPRDNSAVAPGSRTVSLAPFQNQNSNASQGIAGGSAAGMAQHLRIRSGSLVLPINAGAAKASGSFGSSYAGEWDVWLDDQNATPIFLQATASSGAGAPAGAGKRAAGITSEEMLVQFVDDNPLIFRLKDAHNELELKEKKTDDYGNEHVKFTQHHKGIPVWGSMVIGHYSGERGLFAINGRYIPPPTNIKNIVPDISELGAVDITMGDYGSENVIQRLDDMTAKMLEYRGPEAELVVWSKSSGSTPVLAWKVEMRPNVLERWRYFIDAKDSAILDKYQYSPSDAPAVGSGVDLQGVEHELHTIESSGWYYMIDGSDAINLTNSSKGELVTDNRTHFTLQYNAENKLAYVANQSNSFDDAAAVSAHTNTKKVYEYFFNKHGRDSINGTGGNLLAAVHLKDANGGPVANAFWNGVLMMYGDGGDVFHPLSGALDVAAHEMGHGVIERTAGLEYRFQSGALNESFADIFGVLADSEDWLLGEDIVKPAYFPSGAMRSLENPNQLGRDQNGWQPMHMNEFLELTAEQDYGGVHYNSGITNHAAYLIAQQIGQDKMGQLYYHVLSNYLTPTSQFIDLRLAAEETARSLFSDEPEVLAAVKSGFAAVGIGASDDATDDQQEPDSGDDDVVTDAPVERSFWVASVGAGDDGDNSLFIAKPSDDYSDVEPVRGFTQLTRTQVYNETGNAITSPVNGNYLLFIDSDNNLRFINSDGSGEEVINDDGDWGSIAISPDGTKLAATTVWADSTIYILDLENGTVSPFKLYHPTTSSDGERQHITEYADALTWDGNSSYIIYDSFQSQSGAQMEDGSSSDHIEFWDLKAMVPTDGAIYPYSPTLPPGFHMANPSFGTEIIDGKPNDCRFAYEMVDENEPPRNLVISSDRCAGVGGVIVDFPHDMFSFPRFMHNDKEMVLELWTDRGGNETDLAWLFRVPLNEDRVSPADGPHVFMQEKQSPYAFVIEDDQGLLVTAVEEEKSGSQPEAFSLVQNYPNPFNPETVISYEVARPADVSLKVFDVTGQHVTTLVNEFSPTGKYSVTWAGTDSDGYPVASGVYFYEFSHLATSGEQVQFSRKMLLLR